MELKGGVSANLHFIELAILFQEGIREYMSKHSVQSTKSYHYNVFLGNPILHQV